MKRDFASFARESSRTHTLAVGQHGIFPEPCSMPLPVEISQRWSRQTTKPCSRWYSHSSQTHTKTRVWALAVRWCVWTRYIRRALSFSGVQHTGLQQHLVRWRRLILTCSRGHHNALNSGFFMHVPWGLLFFSSSVETDASNGWRAEARTQIIDRHMSAVHPPPRPVFGNMLVKYKKM